METVTMDVLFVLFSFNAKVYCLKDFVKRNIWHLIVKDMPILL